MKNEINNKTLKENLADAALGMLFQGIDYEQLAYISFEFGYLFVMDEQEQHLEALFKVTTDRGIFYFAAQGSTLKRLLLNEELFINTSKKFLSLYE